MTIPEDGYLLRVFVGESDKHERKPLYEWLVLKAREAGLAGATVLRGLMGYGRHSVVHTSKILRLSEDLPMIVEIVDSLQKIEAFLPTLDTMIRDILTNRQFASMREFYGHTQNTPIRYNGFLPGLPNLLYVAVKLLAGHGVERR